MEALVLRKKTFRDPIPSVAQLVHYIGANRVHIRKRDELHAGRRDSIKPRELAAAAGQGQRKGLGAVAKEIASGHDVVGVEIVINLSDHAAEIVQRGSNQRGIGTVWTSASVGLPSRVEIAIRWGCRPRSDVRLRPEL